MLLLNRYKIKGNQPKQKDSSPALSATKPKRIKVIIKRKETNKLQTCIAK